MFNKSILLTESFGLIAIAALVSQLGTTAGDTLATALALVSIVLAALSQAIKPQQLPAESKEFIKAMIKNLSLQADDARIFVERYSSDIDFNNAMIYMQHLSPTEFLRFVRITIEMRQNLEQKVLTEVANILRKKK